MKYFFIAPELSAELNIAIWFWIILMAYEMTMLDSDGHENERKHLITVVLLLVEFIAVMIAHYHFNLL
jgi:hypothetical protein